MISKNEISKGWYKNVPYGGSVTENQNGYTGRQIIVPGLMVNGNHRDPNSWSYDVEIIKYFSGTAITHYYTWGPNAKSYEYGYLPGQVKPGVPAWDPIRTHAYNRALERLNSKVRGDLDLGVTLAEFGQTRKMLKSIAAMRNFAAASGFGTSKDLANGWLQWKYGWKPLMSDLFGVLDESLNIVISTIRRVTGSASFPIRGLGDRNIAWTAAGKYWNTTNSGSGKIACRIVLEIEMPGATLDRWSSLNPVSLLWELTPYSFVIDWVYDVGSFLRAAETALLYDSRFRSGYVSELFAFDGQEVITKPFASWPSSNPPHNVSVSGRHGTVKRRRFARTKLTSYPLPRQPSFKVDLGSERLLTLAALLRQLLK